MPFPIRSFGLGSIALLGLSLVACGDDGLTASGHARIEASDGTRTGFDLPDGVRLDGGTGVTGTCQVTRSVEGDETSYGVLVELFRPAGSDLGLRSLTVMARSDDAVGTIEARIGAGIARSSSCDVELTASDGGDVFLASASCVLSGEDEVTADVELELHGCSVIDAH